MDSAVDNWDERLERVKEKVHTFYKNNLMVFIKRFKDNRSERAEHLNGYIPSSPRADFFFLKDIKEPDHYPAKLVFFHELLHKGAVVDQSRKVYKDGKDD